jgi:hypothetical protein
MTLNAKRAIVATLSILFLIALLIVAWIEGGKQRFEPKPKPVVSGDNKACVNCHTEKTPVIVAQWAESKHAKLGVGCMECHKVDGQAPDGYNHEGKMIHAIVTPNDCARCHGKEVQQFAASHHAKAAQFVGSLDNILGEIVEGRLAAAQGCQQCHGSTVTLIKDKSGAVAKDDRGKPLLDPATWPNTGIGRMNLDGSKGSCTACHSRHIFSRAMARQPETCGKCHMGPDHPQIEIFEESKHGVAFRTRIKEMNLESESWILGVDYTAAPTCATCHMSATPNLPVTHDVGERISWTLRPVISKKLENWEERRQKMTSTCLNCHGPEFIKNWYFEFDAGVDLYNEKFAKPAQKIMDALKQKGRITPSPFDDKIEWTFYHLWHHEGRRARMGLSMQGPDFTQWHGFFEVAHRFYFEFIPEAEELVKEDSEIKQVVEEVMSSTEHQWRKGLSKEAIEKIREFYQERYGQGKEYGVTNQ